MAKIQFIRDVNTGEFEKRLEDCIKNRFSKGMKVAVKLHMGEMKGMFDPELAKRAVAVLKKLGCKPTLFDTPVKYPGPRHFKWSYEKVAALHGYSEKNMGCPVIVCDEYDNIKTDHMDVEVTRELRMSDALLVLSHVKGHDCAGFGGAIKNLAIGCASKNSKADQHSLGMPRVNDKCTGCAVCEKVCPFGAIKVSAKEKAATAGKATVNKGKCVGCDTCVYNCPHKALEADVFFDTLLAEACQAALAATGKKPMFFVNDIRKLTKHCDCFPNPGDPVAKDAGIVMGDDIVAVETATLDIIQKQEGKDIFKEMHHHDPRIHIREAERLGLGKSKYAIEEAPSLQQ